jgi:hypothetical protein
MTRCPGAPRQEVNESVRESERLFPDILREVTRQRRASYACIRGIKAVR